MILNKLIVLFVLCISSFKMMTQNGDKLQMRYDDWLYHDNIQTVQLHESSFDANPPIIQFHTDEILELSFDDLEADRKNYSIAFVHCDANWAPSDLLSAEYMTGFYEANILNFSYSVNTIQNYTHYSVLFPQSNMQFSKTGNYIVYVYLDNDKENLVLTKRFMIYENKVSVLANVKQAIGNDEQYEKQHIDFSIINSQYELTNPFTDLKVVITQNNRWDNAVYGIRPTFTEPKQLTYSLDDKATFNGGNEFRFFESRSLRTYTQRVENIYRDSLNLSHIVIEPDIIKPYVTYSFYVDLNGGYLIKNRDMYGSPDVEADYAWVHFFFPYHNMESEGNFHILGKLSEWRMSPVNQMTYNHKRHGYECKLFIKQGYYNYTYVFVKNGSKVGDETVTEGNHWETENDYAIYVYHRQRGTYYDQLVAIKRLSSAR